jgi:hypothetical protein
MSNRRMSLGGGMKSNGMALRDSSSLFNATSRNGIVSRRLSVGFRSETPKKDRHSMLEDYRLQQQNQNKRSRESSPQPSGDFLNVANINGMTSAFPQRTCSSSKPTHSAPPVPPLPRSIAPTTTFVTEGTSALERFRMRKQQKLHMQMDETSDEGPNSNISYYDIDEPTVNYDNFGLPAILNGTSTIHTSEALPSKPFNRRQSILGAGAAQTLSAAFNSTSLSNEVTNNAKSTSHSQHTDLSQLSQDSLSANHSNVTVESLARYEEMQKRLRKLEEEKVGITIAMAPIEARHRQKENAWMKEQNRLLQEIDSLKEESQKSNERFRDLEALFEAKEEENRQLRLQVRKESSTLYSNNSIEGDGNAWSRHLQVERDLADLKDKLQCAEEEIRAGRLDRVSVEKELHATKIERDSILRAYEELQDEYEIISKTTSDEREAQIKLEVLTTEHIATSAQLNAVCSDFAATKATYKASMEAKEVEYTAVLEKYQFEMSVLKTRAAVIDHDSENRSLHDPDVEDFAVLKAKIEERDRKIAEFEKERLSWECLRRQMHNRIQELEETFEFLFEHVRFCRMMEMSQNPLSMYHLMVNLLLFWMLEQQPRTDFRLIKYSHLPLGKIMFSKKFQTLFKVRWMDIMFVCFLTGKLDPVKPIPCRVAVMVP